MANPRTIARIQARILERAATALTFEVSDPRASFITVTRVELAQDLATGKIFYSVLGDEGDKRNVVHMLESASGYLQRLACRGLNLRNIPHLSWHFDSSIEDAARTEDAILRAIQRDEEIAATGQAPADEDEASEPDADV